MKFNLKRIIFSYRLGNHLLDNVAVLPNFMFKEANTGRIIVKKEGEMLAYEDKQGIARTFGDPEEIRLTVKSVSAEGSAVDEKDGACKQCNGNGCPICDARLAALGNAPHIMLGVGPGTNIEPEEQRKGVK